METFAQIRSEYPTLEIFDFGGGMPVPMTLDFDFDYLHFTKMLLNRMTEICRKNSVTVPNIMGEFGRYTVSEHGAHIFKVLSVKDNGSDLPWYIIDGSVMSSIPDSWALGELFVVLPLNNLDSNFQQVQIGGITCDSDDVYPPKKSNAKLFLPENTENLYIGFFNIGAYQEMLGGVGGSKHCVIPEADELIIDKSPQGEWLLERLPGQSSKNVLKNLGYLVEE
jgi:arginine decarboxylase